MRVGDLLARGVLLLLSLPAVLVAAEPPLPFASKWQHVGMPTCAGSNCHGSAQPFDDSPVLQNEYFTWQRDDAHSNAYKLLESANGRRIAAKLGLASATAAPECLTCHTDYVAQAQRGKRYTMDEGVGCEACHGGAEQWLGPHVAGNTHADNLAQGLYPLEDPVARGRLCLHCHLGSAEKPIDHRLMGAGHPALEFELDTFTNIQPAHFRVDADYRKRKPYTPGAAMWAIGQLLAAEAYLQGLTSARFADHGMFPELVFLDCNACHHPMRPPRWSAGAGGPLAPGLPRLADANLVVASVVLSVAAPASARNWDETLVELQRASAQSVSKTQDVARRLLGQAGQALSLLRSRNFSRAEALDLLDRLAQLGIERQAGNYSVAKQIYYGSDALFFHLRNEHQLPKAALKTPMDAVFAATDTNTGPYNPESLRAALRKLREAVAALK